ncbi:MAG TPA: amino acid adenylation domain-containing protein, partial [Pyrinomonadaceae bacterium]|nr:amino acid adenylation domain-containing protein [Pyrinomonadaceae bacterium]
HELFEAQAARTPDAIALVHESERLSYMELDARANQLARHLRSLGVGPETLVGICVERSPEMLIGLLGVLKAGGAYLPLDPTYPHERLDYMLKDAGVSVVLLQERFSDVLPEHDARVVFLDADRDAISRLDAGRVESDATAQNLAYVIYTSGSTGKPKGVLIPHRSVVNHNFAVVARYDLRPSDRVLQFASLSFDVAVEEIFPTWLGGGCVVLRSPQLLNSDTAFFEFIEREGVTVVNLPTPYWNELIAARARSQTKGTLGLRLVAIGGEKGLPEHFAATLEHLAPDAQLLNVYGPTETTVTNTAHLFDPALFPTSPSVPIGRPLANTRLYLLDASLRPVPTGVPAELYIGGHSLARGYLQRPALTAERFLPDPYTPEAGARMYRSGDVCRRLETGEVEFVGRVDHQVKVRGFRVELGEIEVLLAEHPGVRQAVVVEAAGGGRLCAYVAADEGGPASAAALRAYLKERLPDYMMPSFFVVLDELPLTVNGKVDRRRLPAPSESASHSGQYVAPRAGVEEMVCDILAGVLGVERMGVTDDFFETGGHSLLATQVMSRVRETFRVELPLRTLFEHPHAGEFARRIEEVMNSGKGIQSPTVVRAPRDKALPLSFAQQRLWFLAQLEPDGSAYNVPVAVRLKGALDVVALERTLSEVVRRHEVLRTTFTVTDGEPAQVIHDAGAVSLPVTDLSHLPESARETEAARLAREEATRPFDLEHEPLMRAGLLRLGEQEHVCLLTMHHIVSDGWSVTILVKEVVALYESFSKGEESPLAELTIQYADYAVWQRQWLEGDVLDNQLSYWRKQLGGNLPVVSLPTDRPRSLARRWRGATFRSQLPLALAVSLRALSRQHGATLYMTLLAGFQLLLSRYTGLSDVPVGTAIAGRQRGETEALIGFFVNTLVLRGDLSGDPTFGELVERAREAALGAYAHQDVPFEKLVEELRPERGGGVTPLFQVAFGVQNAPEGELRVGGLEVSGAGAETQAGRFDLTVWVEEETGGGLSCVWTYDTDLFDEARVGEMAGHYGRLLEGCVGEPERRAADIPMHTVAELKRQHDEEQELMNSNLKSLKTMKRKSLNADAR